MIWGPKAQIRPQCRVTTPLWAPGADSGQRTKTRRRGSKFLPKMSPEQALAFSKQKILRFWGLTGQRGWARLILGRLHDPVLFPDDSKGSTLDPDTAAHEHHGFFFPDTGHGAANADGFGWRNGGQSPCVFFAPP